MAIKRLNTIIEKLEELAMIVGSVACVLIVICQIVFRWILQISVPWTDELVRFIFVWVCWIGAAAAMGENSHIDITIIDTILSKTKNKERNIRIINFLAIVLSIVLLIIFVAVYRDYYATVLAGSQRSVVMKIHYKWPMGAVLFGSILMIYHGIYNLIPKKNNVDAANIKEEVSEEATT